MQQVSFLPQFAQVVRGEMPADQFAQLYNLSLETVPLMEQLAGELEAIHTSFFASTATGVMVHFLGAETFPEELFTATDTARCRVRLEMTEGNRRAYYLQFAEDEQERRFYFAPPEGIQEQQLYGWEQKKGDERERILYV